MDRERERRERIKDGHRWMESSSGERSALRLSKSGRGLSLH